MTLNSVDCAWFLTVRSATLTIDPHIFSPVRVIGWILTVPVAIVLIFLPFPPDHSLSTLLKNHPKASKTN